MRMHNTAEADPVLIVSLDVDRTQLPSKNLVTQTSDPTYPDSFRLKDIFEELQAAGTVRLVHNSGRSLPQILQNVLPTPENLGPVLALPAAIISSVGTEIYLMQGTEPKLLPSWEDQMLKQFPQELRAELLTDFRKAFAGNPAIKLQPTTKQGRHKLSFELTGDHPADSAAALDRIFNKFTNVRTTFSHGWAYDVTPKSATKGTALEHLADHWKIPFHNCVVGGDSGNDLPMFRPDFRGIVVGNADDQLRDGLRFHRQKIVYAKGHIAAGIIEGLQELNILTPQPLAPAMRQPLATTALRNG